MAAVGEIVNQIAKMQYMSSGRLKMPILLRGCIGIGHSAATHHSGNYYPMYAHFPGLRVVVPSTPYDAKGLLHHALRCDDPVVFLEHRELLSTRGPVPEQPYEIPFGRAAVVRPPGGVASNSIVSPWTNDATRTAVTRMPASGDWLPSPNRRP